MLLPNKTTSFIQLAVFPIGVAETRMYSETTIQYWEDKILSSVFSFVFRLKQLMLVVYVFVFRLRYALVS